MTSSDFESPEVEVKLYFKACKVFMVKAASRADAHKAAYNLFMDSPENSILAESSIADYWIETEIEGEEGSDMLHN